MTLTGQDGFGNNDARTFTATPGGYTFGVCSAAVAGVPAARGMRGEPVLGAAGDGHHPARRR